MPVRVEPVERRSDCIQGPFSNRNVRLLAYTSGGMNAGDLGRLSGAGCPLSRSLPAPFMEFFHLKLVLNLHRCYHTMCL